MWEKLLSKKRYKIRDNTPYIKEDSNDERYRNSFHKDYDRIIFSNSFRALSKKTQVHPLVKNDHVHNRLTHSLEVASVSRTLGIRAGELINKKFGFNIEPQDVAYIIQSASLAHDIGNPPFGHAGEEVIKEWFRKNEHLELFGELSQKQMSDFKNFDGNAQSFRIVTNLENSLFKGGMSLTFATLGSLIKYPHSSSECAKIKKEKFNFFESEKEFFETLFLHLGLKKGENFIRHPLSYLMESADDICYGLLDLQDAYMLNLIDFKSDIEPIFKALCTKESQSWVFQNRDMNTQQKISTLNAYGIDNLTTGVIELFEENIEAILNGDMSDLISNLKESHLKEALSSAKSLAKEKIFKQRRKIELEIGAYNTIEILLENMIKASYELHLKGGEFKNSKKVDKISFKNRQILELMEKNAPTLNMSLYNKYQRVVDYVVSLTDNHATYLAHQFSGMGY